MAGLGVALQSNSMRGMVINFSEHGNARHSSARPFTARRYMAWFF